MEQIAARGALGGDLAMTEACFSMNNPRSRGGGTPVRSSTCFSIRLRGEEVPLNWTSSNKRDRYWNLSGILHVTVPRLLGCGAVSSVSGLVRADGAGMGKT